jgi:hypothetical protein
MNNIEFNELLDKTILREIIKTRDSGGQEYARSDENIFANFERVSNTLDISVEEVIMTYTLKHIDGIVAHIKGHVSQREDVRGRITDAAVYLFLLWGYLVKDESESTNVDEETNVTPTDLFTKTVAMGYTLSEDGKRVNIPTDVEITPLMTSPAHEEAVKAIKKQASGGCCGNAKKSKK